MKWARFRSKEGRIGFGTIDGAQIREFDGDLFADPIPTSRRVALSECTLESPCVPSKLIALWNNFHELSAKLGKAAPAHPLFLIKSATSVIGPGVQIRRPKSYQGKIAYEGELGIVIGKTCRDVPRSQAAEHILGYTCVNDVTALGVLNENADFAQWCRAKSHDTFGCVGPVIETEFNFADARVVTRLDGVERQNYPLSDMIMPPEEVVSLVSGDVTLLPGDVIACGTSVGVGSIKDGALVEISIEGIGSLSNALAGSA